MSLPPNEIRPPRIPAVAAALVAGIAITVLGGWAVDSRVLKCVIPGMASMKVNTALELMFLAAGLFGLYRRRGAWWTVGRVGVAMAAILCLLTAAEYVFDVDLRIDNAVFQDWESVTHPGRNAPATIACFLAVAAAVVLLDLRGRAVTVAQGLLVVTSAVPLATLGGYLYRAPGMYASVKYPVVALSTAVALVLLCFGGMWARPHGGLMRVAVSRTGAGSLARRLLPLAVAVPLGVGVATLAGHRSGFFGAEFGSALLVTGCVIFFAASVFWAASLLYAAEGERDESLVRERAARSRAEAAVLARDQLLAVVSHELRTPLTPILLLVTALTERDDLPDDALEDLHVVREQAQAEMLVVTDLLDLVGLRQGQLRLACENADVRELVRSAAAAATAALAERRIDFTVDLLCTRDTHACVDRNRLRQVLRNLLDNAAKFTPEGGRVTIRCVDADAAAGRAVIEVEDTGVGIAAADVERIFDAFQQADSSTTRRFGGLGLGLTISRMLTTLHGGTLTASSAGVGKGATFRVSLPSVPAPVEASIADAPAAHPPTFLPVRETERAAPAAALRKLLLVEDHEETRSAISRLLRHHGYDVTTAATAADAVDLAAHGSFDVVISDIGLPDLSGWDMMRRLRERGPVRGIAVSGFTADEDRRRSLEAGYLAHLGKPIDLPRLIEAIEAVGEPKPSDFDTKT